MQRLQTYLAFTLFLFTGIITQAQEGKSIDRVIAVVGDNIVLQSELEAQYMQMQQQGYDMGENAKCAVLEELLYQKLLLNQAKLDSVVLSEDQIEGELDRRIRYFSGQLGGEDKLEEYYGKSIIEIKSEFRDIIQDQLLSQQMQQSITADISITPSEVRAYFERIPKDSLPFINSEVEVGRILKKPVISDEAKEAAKQKAIDLRKRVLEGEEFSFLASIYSDDPVSGAQGGDLGYFERGQMVPEFDAVAFRLKEKDEISEVFESPFGYHFMKMIDRKGERVRTSHILVKATTTRNDLTRAKEELDSIYQLIFNDSITFAEAALEFSDDDESKGNDGILINPQTGTNKFETSQLSQIEPTILFSLDKMEVGDIEEASLTTTPDGGEAYHILFLKSRTKPHTANLKEDYQKIQSAATVEKQAKTIQNWIKEKSNETFVKINADFHQCDYENAWMTKDPQ